MLDRDRLLRRIQRLLAVAAEGSGATGPERGTARGLADKLMAEHRLSEADVARGAVESASPAAGAWVVVVNVGNWNVFGANNQTTDNSWWFGQ